MMACRMCGGDVPVVDGRSARRTTCSKACRNAYRASTYKPRPPKARATLAERLWARVVKQPSGCWEWQGYRTPFGHGQIGAGGSRGAGNLMTHRAAWMLTNGPIPPGHVVRHRCDNPPCCNPEHLELGDQALNVRDMVIRNRVAKGERLPQTKLSADAVRAIRSAVAAGRAQADVAAEFGTTQGYVSTLVAGRHRRDVA